MSKRYLLALILVGLFIVGFIVLSKSTISNESSNDEWGTVAGTIYDERPDMRVREYKRKSPGPTTGFGKYGP